MQGCKPCILLELSKQTFAKINFPLHWTLCQKEAHLSCLCSLSCLRKAHEADWIGISQVQVAGLTDAELTTVCPEPLRNRTKRKDSHILYDGKTGTRGSNPSLPWNGDLCSSVVKCNRLQGGPLSKLAGASVQTPSWLCHLQGMCLWFLHSCSLHVWSCRQLGMVPAKRVFYWWDFLKHLTFVLYWIHSIILQIVSIYLNQEQ